jgi:hypothetical protein
LGKQTRLPFASSTHRAEKPFDLVHLDLWTFPIVNVPDYKYYLVILDDYTHYLWTFPLKHKSDTFTTLSNFFAYVSTQFGYTVKAIQCDNGREFDNSSTHTFLLMKGVCFRCHVRTPHPRMVKSNVSFVLSIMSSAPCCFRRIFLSATGLRGFTPLHTS